MYDMTRKVVKILTIERDFSILLIRGLDHETVLHSLNLTSG